MDKDYGTIPKTLELRFTKEKNMTNFKNYENFIYNGKNYVIDQNNFSFWTNI